MAVFTSIETFEIVHCYKCGIAFGMTTSFQSRRLSQKDMFYCPNGHGQAFLGMTDKDRAQRLAGELDMANTRLREARKAADYAARARKAASTRLRKVKQRVGHGVCPCCNRTFKQLARHMEDKHPQYAGETP